ncbi:MAG: class I SAM-dependent methyltransferase [Veillonella sp.]|uniref:class I SAM-dependent methyltransferase n=1 Tax=Veillonella sp. TaxID=1926307 RepID=UPI0025CDCD12|nr:class I SAM-dependent methyltransferase [Veillonella sp.]MBS4912825.1 class I SAM-dependent methyltransferase [Veillonella sp.]
MRSAFVTTSQNVGAAEIHAARHAASLLNLPYVERKKHSMSKLQSLYGDSDILIMSKQGPQLYTGEGVNHKFHLSMAQLRIIAYDRGQTEHLLNAVGSEPIESFLDCTAGLCSDSLMVTYSHPELERLYALEGNPLLAYISNYGCRHFVHESQQVTDALRRIQVFALRYESVLARADSDSIDIVYFDPMFEVPVTESPQFLGLRGHIVETPLTEAMLNEAKRVARKKVIVKERPFATVFKTFPPDYVEGGTYSRVAYGVYEV